MIQVMFGRVRRVFGGVRLMRVRQLRVMSSLMVVAGIVVFRGLGVVMGGHTVMMRRLAVFVRCLL